MLSVTQADPANDQGRVIACLVTAFASDPFIRWMFPDSRQYLYSFPLVLEHFAGGAFEHRSAYHSDDFKGAALWLPPVVGPDEEALGAVVDAGVPDKLKEEVFEVLEQVGEGHPADQHWYLPALGVDPKSQRQGRALALMQCSLERCDRDHLAAPSIGAWVSRLLEKFKPVVHPFSPECSAPHDNGAGGVAGAYCRDAKVTDVPAVECQFWIAPAATE